MSLHRNVKNRTLFELNYAVRRYTVEFLVRLRPCCIDCCERVILLHEACANYSRKEVSTVMERIHFKNVIGGVEVARMSIWEATVVGNKESSTNS